MSNQYSVISGGSPIDVNPDTNEITLAPALQGQKLYFDGADWQFRAEYGDHDYVVGTETGDYANVQAAITAAGLPIFPTTQQTLKIFIKNSVAEPAALTVPANSRILITVGPGVEYTCTNTVTLVGTGSATQPSSLIFIGQAPQSSTLRFDRPSGGFLITKTGANRVRFETRNIRVLKANVVNVGSTAVLVDPAATLIRQVYDRTTFLVNGNCDGFLGNSAGTSALLDMRITRCNIDTSINPIAGTASTLTNVLRSSSANSNVYVDELAIITATALNGVIISVTDGSQSTYRNVRISNDATGVVNNSNVIFNCRYVENICQINTIATSNITFAIDSPTNPAVPQGAKYSSINATTILFNKQTAGGIIQRVYFDNLNCTSLLFTAAVPNGSAMADCTFSNVMCGIFLQEANFGINRCVFDKLNILGTANPFEVGTVDCTFLNLRTTDGTNGITCRGVECVFVNPSTNGPYVFTLASACTISDCGVTGNSSATSFTIGDTGNVLRNVKGFSIPFNIVNSTSAFAKNNVHFDQIYSVSQPLTITVTNAATRITVSNSVLSHIAVSANAGGSLTPFITFINCRFEGTTTNTVVGSNISYIGCYFAAPITHDGPRSYWSNTSVAGTGVGITLSNGTLSSMNNLQIQSTGGITVGTSNSVQMANVRCTQVAADITFTDAAGTSYQLSNCRCNSIVFQGGQTFTQVTGCRTAIALPVAATTAAGNAVG